MTHEAYRARDNWDFVVAFEKAFDINSIELNQTPLFWELMRRAHKDAVILRLGRLYDPASTAASLGNLLQTMRENTVLASPEFSLLIANLEMTELACEITEVSDADPVVAKLLSLRNEYLAHRSARQVTKGTFASLPSLDRDEISALITRALKILSKYRHSLGYQQLSWGHQEAEEFQTLLSLLRAGRDSKMRRHIARLPSST